MLYVFEAVSVDAGIIVIADKSHYDPYGPLRSPPAYERKLEAGEYAVRWEMPQTWNGKKVTGKGHLSITSGVMWVSDPGYMVADKKWDEYLKKCIWARKKPEGILILDKMGGDGSFDVKLELRRE